jgi:hypothetical protein
MMTNPYIVTVRYTRDGHSQPRFEQHFGPFRSESVARRNQDVLEGRIARHLERKVDRYNDGHDDAVYLDVEVTQLDNRAARYHYLDLETALEQDGVI